ncbi:DUF4097 family beta strand repeat-containing protein [Haploplasma axanthum]|uniref:DUF4097 domain-containing protein n=1 Tax=Haploplasma axanthum TaxID=29552 RepID=A0A449BEG8_HAPAX|nr:DUF4097 family beta strand repeat-containing protein [Haploplasma axanthum]VEU80854.1 Uncharacterised protein [Haploplasma axanthum]
MKIFKAIILFGFIIGALLIVIGFVAGGSISGVKDVFVWDSRYVKQENYLIDNSVNEIEINSDSRNIKINKTDEKNSFIEYYLYENKETIGFELNNNKLSIKQKDSRFKFPWVSIGGATKKVSTIIVNLTNDDVKKLKLTTSSGSVELENIKADFLDIKINSGSLKIENGVLNNTNVSIDSGSTTITKLTTNSAKFDVDSGRVSIAEIFGEILDINIDSGSIRITDNNIKKNKFKIDSGSIRVTDKREKNKIGYKAKTSSGSIKVFGEKYNELSDRLELFEIIYEINISSGSITIS